MIKCTACGISNEEVDILKSNDFNICSNCVKSAYSIFFEEDNIQLKQKFDNNLNKIIDNIKENENKVERLTPKEIRDKLDDFVIGQNKTKKILSVAVFNHFERINNNDKDLSFDKSNALLIGPSGSGKTLLAKTIAKAFDVPIVISDATSLTQAGYTGDDVEGILTRLVEAADGDIERAERGIIFIDEIDKIASMKNAQHGKADAVGKGVQHGLLKIIEGAEVSFPLSGSRKNANEPTAKINTNNILFICSGAFSELPNIINSRINKKQAMGFTVPENEEPLDLEEVLEHVQTDDLIEFGLIPEFLGRLPVVTTLRELTKEEMLRVLTEPKNSIISQYVELLKLNNVELSFDDSALASIVNDCLDNKIGVRNLRSVIEKIMLDIIYNISDYSMKKIIITGEYTSSLDLKDLDTQPTLIFKEDNEDIDSNDSSIG